MICVLCCVREACAGPLLGSSRWEQTYTYCAACWKAMQPIPESCGYDDELDRDLDFEAAREQSAYRGES